MCRMLLVPISLTRSLFTVSPDRLSKRATTCGLVDFLKVLSNSFPWAVGFAVGKVDLSRLTSLELALATSSLEITFSLRSRVINKKRSTCGKSSGLGFQPLREPASLASHLVGRGREVWGRGGGDGE